VNQFSHCWQFYFSLALAESSIKISINENLHENPDVGPGGNDLHERFCGRETELQKNRQELPDERQEGMQLRERLRLR
jgi:hypothetical protein